MTPRVLVTRPDPDTLCAALAARHLEPVAVPVLEEVFLEAAAGPEVAWAVWASPRAVRAGFGLSTGAPRHAAVGEATAAALRVHGARAEVIGAGGARNLLGALAAFAPLGDVLLVRSGLASLDMTDGLRDLGATVHARTAYTLRAVPGPALRAHLAAAGTLQAATFCSPSAVHAWLACAPSVPDVLAAIGPTTAAALRAGLRAPDIVAARPDVTSLAAGVEEFLAKGATR